jgi:hypothetical protein
MKRNRTSAWRSALCALAALLSISLGASTRAQTLPYGSIGLYVDEARTANTVSYAGPYTEFTLYVYCKPGEQGLAAVEFAVAYPPNVMPGETTPNPLLSIEFGDLGTGMSVAFIECQHDWVWTHHQLVYLLDTSAARIEIAKHQDSGAYQLATCEPGYPTEAVLLASSICLNSASCPPDTTRPLVTGAEKTAPSAVTIAFSEPVFEPAAENIANYEIYRSDNPAITLAISQAELYSDGRSVGLYLAAPFPTDGATYVVRVHGVCDLWGNEVPPSSEATLTAADHEAPRLVRAWASDVNTIMVEFSEPVAAATAEVLGNYRLYFYIEPGFPPGDIPCQKYPYEAALVAANRVRLSYDDANTLPESRWLWIRITNVTDLAGNVISPDHNTSGFLVTEQNPPILQAVTVESSTIIRAQFNEAVTDASANATDNYSLRLAADTLATIPIVSAVLQADKQWVVLNLGAPITCKLSYVLRARGVIDMSGNRMPAWSTAQFAWPDQCPPVPLSATPFSHTLLRIVFDEVVEAASGETRTNYAVYETAIPSAVIPVVRAERETTGEAVDLTLGSLLSHNIEYTVCVTGVKNLYGIAITQSCLTTVYSDTLPFALTDVIVAQRSLDLVFNRSLDQSTAEDETHYALFESSEPSLAIAIMDAQISGGSSRVRLSLGSNLVDGLDYTVTVEDVLDADGEVIAEGTAYEFTFVDTIPPVLLSAHETSRTTVAAYFSEPLDETWAQNPACYALFKSTPPTGDVVVSSASLTGDSSSVLLSLASDLVDGATYMLLVGGLRDRKGNLIAPNSEAQFTVVDTMPPYIQSISIENDSTLWVFFNETVDAATANWSHNYQLVVHSSPPDTQGANEILSVQDRIVVVRFSPGLTRGLRHTLRVRNVADLAGNVIVGASEKSFIPSPYPGGSDIGLYTNWERTRYMVYPGTTAFYVFVWCRPSSFGMRGAEFTIDIPWSNVVPDDVLLNEPLVSSSSGEPWSGMTVSFSQCVSDWVWVCRMRCLLLDRRETIVGLSASSGYPAFVTCAEGGPTETPNIVSVVYCNRAVISTLLKEFAASYRDGGIDVAWSLSEIGEGVRFIVSRAEVGSADYLPLAGTISSDGLTFSYRDESLESGATYRYRVNLVDASGTSTLFETEPVAVPVLPVTLSQNWPNPFNPTTRIEYYLPRAMEVRLEVYDVAGHRIARLVSKQEEAGRHEASWNGSDESGSPVAAGIYMCRLTAGSTILSRKMILLR